MIRFDAGTFLTLVAAAWCATLLLAALRLSGGLGWPERLDQQYRCPHCHTYRTGPICRRCLKGGEPED